MWFLNGIGQDLARYLVGTSLALHQVNVFCRNSGWEVAATEATQIELCPEELRHSLGSATDLSTPGITLTRATRVDYNTVKTQPATMSGLALVIQSNAPGHLDGV